MQFLTGEDFPKSMTNQFNKIKVIIKITNLDCQKKRKETLTKGIIDGYAGPSVES